jgi:hypothetical protein
MHRRASRPIFGSRVFKRTSAIPRIGGDSPILDAIACALFWRRPQYRASAPADTDRLLDTVIADAALPDGHPLKVNALLTRASRAAADKQIDQAQRYFERTGLTEQQCALIGVSPALRSVGDLNSAYPMAAMQMGFEGWVRLEFDVNADGSAIQPRPVVAYPPIVFNDAAQGMARNFRYQASYRPSNGEACTGQQQLVTFRLPD